MRHRFAAPDRRIAAVFVAAALSCAPAHAEGAHPSAAAQGPASQREEWSAKANFLYHVALFAKWPGPPDAGTPWTICVLGASPVTQALRPFEAQVVGGRPLRLRELRDGGGAGGCDVLFVPAGNDRRLSSTLASLKGEPVLTVGEDDGFLAAGGMLRLTVRDTRLRFDVDLEPAERAGIVLSSRLLEQAATVTRGGHVVKP